MGIEKPLSNSEFMQSLMKVAKLGWIVVILTIFTITLSTAQAQDGDEEATEDVCIFSTFCVVMIFIFFLVYFSSRRRNRDDQYSQGTNIPRYPPRQPGYRYPMPPTYQSPVRIQGQRPPPPKTEIKCDLCDSKNLRVFEDGYYKCNDCRHVFYHTESSRKRR